MAFQNAWYHCWIAWQRNGYQIRRCHELTRTKQSFNPMIKLTSPIQVWNKDTNSCYSTPSRILGLMSVLWITLPALESLIRRLWSTCCMTMIKSNPVSNKAGIRELAFNRRFIIQNILFVLVIRIVCILCILLKVSQFYPCSHNVIVKLNKLLSKTGSGPKHFRIFVTVQTPL